MSRKKLLILVIFLILIIGTAGGLYWFKNYREAKVRETLNNWINSSSNIAKISYQKVDVPLFGNKAVIYSVKIKYQDFPEDILIKKIEVYPIPLFNPKETFKNYGIDLKEIKINIYKLFPTYKDLLKELNISPWITANMGMHYSYDKSKKIFDLKSFYIDLPNLAEIELSGKIKNFVINKKLKPEDVEKEEIVYSKLVYTDKGLVPKLFEVVSKVTDISVKKLKNIIISRLEEIKKECKEKKCTEAFNDLEKFIKTPYKIVITLNPVRPISLGEIEKIQSFEEWEKTLRVKVTVISPKEEK
ncbi:MAG: hypothetical protein GXO57_08430 [Thermodesulfobacteria bacterium]|nr:hypothetical protein [Thermodesulfobacteriota bacterium]